jgi:WD40 repeat protein
LASASADSKVIIWNTASSTRVTTLTGHTGVVNCVILLYNGYIATGADDFTVRIWKWYISSPFTVATITYGSSIIYALTDLKNGNIAAGCSDQKIAIWSLSTGNLISTMGGDIEFFISSLIFNKYIHSRSIRSYSCCLFVDLHIKHNDCFRRIHTR